MIINLKKIKYYFLTTGRDNERKNHIIDIFKEYDITEVNPILDIPNLQSGSIGMGRMIDLGLRNQDRDKPFQPFIIMEDDVSFYRDFPETLEIPDDSDLFYIGISKCGSFDNKDKELIIAEDVKNNDNILKIYNMLSCHGIMICSALGATFYQRCMIEGFIKNTYWDLPLSNMHPYYNVYALKVPLVYQDHKYRGCEIPTKFELQNYVTPENKEFYKNDLLYGMCYYIKKDVYYSPYLVGGLGNQMFQVASVYGLSRKHNRKYISNENNIDNSQTLLHSKNKYNNYFNTIFSKLTEYKNNSIELKIFREPFNQIGQLHNTVFKENTLFYGYYQNYHNWDGFENEIKNLFNFENNTELNKKYDVDNSFFIHFRRGDYVNNKYHEVVTDEYYKKALEKFKTKKILIFSNEKDYGLELDFLKDYEKVFVDEDEITSMNIMKNCKYGGICANSSFSWWGGYLNTSTEKIITVPFIWFGYISDIKDYSGYFCDDFNVITF